MERSSTILQAAVACAFALLASPGTAAEAGHFHHLHLNVSDVKQTTEFYRKNLGVVPIDYAGRIPAMLLERSFLFMNRMDASRIANHQLTGLTHGSWATPNGQQASDWLRTQGVQFYQPIEELQPGSTYMYIYGPDREVIELTDATRQMRFNHIHMIATDAAAAKATAEWLRDLIQFDQPVVMGPLLNANLSIDGVLFAILPIGARFTPRENDGTLRNTEGSHLDHVAFSFRDLAAAYRRIRASGVAIVRPMARDPEYGFRHFFVRAPNNVLVELVEAPSWPAAAWER